MEEFNPPNSLKSLYATKVVDNKFYGEIKIDSINVYNPTIGERIINLENFIIRIENNNAMVDSLFNRDMLYKLIKLKMEKLIIDHC